VAEVKTRASFIIIVPVIPVRLLPSGAIFLPQRSILNPRLLSMADDNTIEEISPGYLMLPE
jgi:hypothetical protein